MNDDLSCRFPKTMRLLKQEEFDAVFADKVSYADHLLIVYARKNGLAFSRLGLKVSKRNAGKHAVDRNCWKRLIREAFRLQQHEIPFGMDFVVLPQKGRQPEFHAVCDSLRHLKKRLADRLKRNNE